MLRGAAVRYNPNGSLDTGFGTGGKVNTPVTGTAADYAFDVAAQGTTTVLVGRTAKPSHNDFAAVRLNDDGSLGTPGRSRVDVDAFVVLCADPSLRAGD